MLIVLIVVVYLKLKPAGQLRLDRILAIALAMSYILRWLWALIIGRYKLDENLPLQLCSVSAIMIIAAVFSQKTLLMAFGYACGLPAGLAVFAMPGPARYPLVHFFYLLFILSHILLVLMPLLWVTSRRLVPDIRQLPKIFLILLPFAALALSLNSLIGANFMYLNGVPGGLGVTGLADALGNPGYQFVMIALLLVIWVILFLPFSIHNRRRAT